MDIWEGAWVKITHIDENLPEKTLSHKLGTRQKEAMGIVTAVSVPGFDSDAIRVEHRDPFGEKNGGWGIYFPGEYEIIPSFS
jgi:hypothetical protein